MKYYKKMVQEFKDLIAEDEDIWDPEEIVGAMGHNTAGAPDWMTLTAEALFDMQKSAEEGVYAIFSEVANEYHIGLADKEVIEDEDFTEERSLVRSFFSESVRALDLDVGNSMVEYVPYTAMMFENVSQKIIKKISDPISTLKGHILLGPMSKSDIYGTKVYMSRHLHRILKTVKYLGDLKNGHSREYLLTFAQWMDESLAYDFISDENDASGSDQLLERMYKLWARDFRQIINLYEELYNIYDL